MYVKELTYCSNNSQAFSKLSHLPLSVWLDSGHPRIQTGRFDIISAQPDNYLEVINEQAFLVQAEQRQVIAAENILSQLDELIEQQQKIYLQNLQNSEIELPFIGGAIGFLSYDFARHLENLPSQADNDITFPQLTVGIYHWAIVTDHKLQKNYFVSYLPTEQAEEKFQNLLSLLEHDSTPQETFSLNSEFVSNMNFPSYEKKLKQTLQYIYDGECYEVNIAQRFSASYLGSAYQAYQYLRQHNPAPFSAYMKTNHGEIVSCSPERFLKIHNHQVETKPIKGTRPRGKTPEQDKAYANELLASEKDHAENLMIVDLMRNDLSKICEPFSINVPKFCALESFANVHHLVSTVHGKLNSHIKLSDIIQASFPGGSITGAPKIRSMEIIDELEPNRRQVYCGSLFYYDLRGSMDSNIMIRTLLCHENTIYVYGGGAIVADSDIQEEYQESIAKVSNIIRLLREVSTES